MVSKCSRVVHSIWMVYLVFLAACAPLDVPATPTTTEIPPPVLTPTATSTLTPTPRTPPSLPLIFQEDAFTPYGTPHAYLGDTCQYLKDKWSSLNSAPGSVVMVIMFHSITRTTVTSSDQMSEFDLRLLMNALHDQGFQAITTAQLLGFLEHNSKIPERSVLLVVDDRRTSAYYDAWFREYWQNWSWPVVNAWISTDLSTADLWQQQIDLENEGFVDHQAHGFQHFAIGLDSSDSYILQELQKPIEAFQQYFHKQPIAFIWPGGRITPKAVRMARSVGYQLGFTTNPRGPLMFNWVPLADTLDPQRPNWDAEGPSADPLLVMPRYWDTDASLHIPEVEQLGQDAANYAARYKSVELEYYDILCASTYGPIP